MKRTDELSAEEFYALRDMRTETLVASAALQSASLALSIDAREADTFAGQLCFLTLANLSARWCRRIHIATPETATHPALYGLGSGPLATVALDAMRRADPFGTFSTCTAPERAVAIHVGMEAPDGAYAVTGRGWTASAGQHVQANGMSGEERNPLGASLAAAIGTCYGMRRSLNQTNIFADARLSLWNLSEDGEAEDGPALSQGTLGRILIVGTGAIGSGIAYLLPFLLQRPELVDLVDCDAIDYSNLNRVPLFFADEVGIPKVEVVRGYLDRWGIGGRSFHSLFRDAGLRLLDYDLLVPAANEFGARESIMHNTPPLMVSASTGSQWDAFRQRHIPLRDDCLVCRFPRNQHPAKLDCSTGSLTSTAAQGAPEETGALPFLSLAGAAMAASEIAKLAYEGFPMDGNFASLRFDGEVLRFMSTNRAKRPGCSYCINPEIYASLAKNHAFASLSTIIS